LDENESVGTAAYGGDEGLQHVIFAITEIVGAAAHEADPSRERSVGKAVYAVIASPGLEGAVAHGVDVELEQAVLDATAGGKAFRATLVVVFSITELVEAAVYGVAFIEVVFAGRHIVGTAAYAADPPRRQSTAEVEKNGAMLVVVFSIIELVGADAYWEDAGLGEVVFAGTELGVVIEGIKKLDV
jgi:hypothetical protein